MTKQQIICYGINLNVSAQFQLLKTTWTALGEIYGVHELVINKEVMVT